MRRIRFIGRGLAPLALVALTVLVALAVVARAASAAAPETDVQKLQAKVENLELQVRSLDAQIKALEARLKVMEPRSASSVAGGIPAATAPPAAAAAPAVSEAQEAEAQSLITEVQRLADLGQPQPALAKLSEVQNRYGSTRAGGYAGYYGRELEVFGKAAPAKWDVEKWIQGDKKIDLSGKKPTLVVFWEEWCPHCRDEMPKFEKLYEAHGKEGLQILGLTRITQTSTEDKVRQYVSQVGVQFPVAKESGSLSTYFNVAGIPAAAVVKDGKVVWRGHPARITDEMIKRWVAASTSSPRKSA